MTVVVKPFDLGAETQFPRSRMRTLHAPARSIISVSLRDVAVEPEGARVRLLIQVMNADRESVGVVGPDGPVLREEQVVAPLDGVSFDLFRSDFGCPSTTRVRVRILGDDPPARVSGQIRFEYTAPDTVRLQLAGPDSVSLDGDPESVVTRDLLPVHSSATGVPGLEPVIMGVGRFSIRAKWHVDPLAAGFVPAYRVLTVSLRRPNGTVAAEETGFSQHVSANVLQDTPGLEPGELDDFRHRVSFDYQVRPEDIQDVDQRFSFWKISVRGAPLGLGQKLPIIAFGIDSEGDTSFWGGGFSSTFRANCD